jgi:2-dehydropantoate 2-reductase
MRILVVGAGGIGGYFGGRLLAAGRDVTFLVREKRAAALAETGLVVRSKLGDLDIASPPTVTAEALKEKFDLILLSCKAFDLDGAMESFAPAVGDGTAILPLLNGMHHLETLAERFGAAHVLGGQCVISVVLDPQGRILHLNDADLLSFGDLDGGSSPRAEAILAALSNAGFEARLGTAIRQEMWEKWAFIATVAGMTCLMRAAIGDIVAAGAADLTLSLLDECAGIARAQGFPPSEASLSRTRGGFTAAGSTFTASMLRDIEGGGRIEADHVLGDLLRRGGEAGRFPLLRIAYAHLKAYEARRARTGA